MLFSKHSIILFICFISVVLAHANATESQTKNDLNQIQTSLKSSVKQLNNQQQQIAAIENKLKKSETQIADNSKSLTQLAFDIELNKNEQQQINQQISALEQRKIQQQNALKNQFKSAYMTGSHDYSKLLLNQENIATFERTLNYYSYLNKARDRKSTRLNSSH